MPSSVSTDAQTVSALRKETPWQHSLPVPVRELLAGGVAGGLSKTSVAPLERCKILFQTGKVQHGSVVRALTDIFRSEGFVGFFRGNGASVMRIVPYSALYMSSYERYRRLLVDVRFMAEYAEEGRTSPVVDLVAGSAAGASAVVVTYPLDLVHTRLAVMIESKPGNGAPGGVQGSRGGAAAGPAGTAGTAAPSAAAGTGRVASLPFPSLRTVTAAGAAAEGAAGAAAEGAAAAAAAAGVGGAAGGGSGGGRGGPVSTTPHQGPGPPGSKSFSSRPAVGGPGAQLMAVERGRTLVGRAGTSTHSSGVLFQGAQKGASAGPFVVQGVAPAGGLGAGPAAAAGARPGTRGIRTTVVAAAGHPRPTIAGVLLSTLRQEGVRGVYHGMGPSLYGILPYAGLKFYMYQALKGRFHSLFPERMTGAKNNRLPVPVMLAYGAVAGLVAQTLTYPLDVVRRRMQKAVRQAGIDESPASPDNLPWFDLLAHPAKWKLEQAYLNNASIEQLVGLGKMTSLEHRRHKVEPTVLGLQEMLAYGLRGLCAYTHHAEVLGQRAKEVDEFVAEAYAFLSSEKASDVNNVLGMILKCGEINLKAMEILDRGHTTKFGDPVPTQVRLTPVKGQAILVSGHDMQDLHDLCEQTAGTGINIYTHGELLPAHGYPGLKEKFPHLVGNYGGAWYRQQRDFAEFPGAVLMTTNCIIEPRQTYKDRIFTTGEVGYGGVNHIEGPIGQTKDYRRVIEAAKELPGFTHEPEEAKFVTTGFARNAVLGVAGQVVDAVQQGHLRHIFLIGGCDGSQPERKYFGKVADATPQDTMILTLGCGKFRFYDHDYGMLPNTQLPRLVDMGQCNDAYSAIVVASKLAEVFGTDVNGLPLSMDLSWLEQKAVVILCSLLHLGIKNIRIGPHAPAFLTPEALQVVVDTFGLKISDVKHPEADVQSMLAKA